MLVAHTGERNRERGREGGREGGREEGREGRSDSSPEGLRFTG